MKKFIAIAIAAAALAGCKTTETMYHYGEYTTAVYSYFKAQDLSLEDQISVLEEAIQNAESENKPIAPGVHAHLGMLYFETGEPNLGTEHFNQEKSLFPESSHYINYLLNSAGGA